MTAKLPAPNTRTPLLNALLNGFLHPETRRQDMLTSVQQMVDQFGDLSYYEIGSFKVAVVSHPDDIHHILVEDAARYHKPDVTKKQLGKFLGNGILISDGEFWRRQRKLTQPAFHYKRIESYAETMVDFAEDIASQWQDGAVVDVADDMMRLTLNIIAKTMFNVEVGEEAERVGEAMEVVQESSARPRLVSIPAWLPTAQNRRDKHALELLDEIIEGIIDERRASKEDRGDLLSMLLLAQDDADGQMTDRQVRDEAMTLFLAGHETTAVTLSWAWLLLAQHPEVAAKLHAELDTVLAGRAPTLADLSALPYTDLIVKEVLRLYPAAHTFVRQNITGTHIREFTFPEGTIFEISPFVVHRDPRWWDEPERFWPERWEEGSLREQPKYAYFPFGGGPRVCIGQQFAVMEARLILAALAQHFHLELASAEPVELEPLITLRPKGGLRMRTLARTPIAVHP